MRDLRLLAWWAKVWVDLARTGVAFGAYQLEAAAGAVWDKVRHWVS